MSYASIKGRIGQNDVKFFLQKLFSDYNFISLTGSEKNRKLRHGDVIAPDNHLLSNYFLEVKKQAQPQVFNDYKKAEDDSEMAGKRGAILFAIKQAKGNKGQRIVVMSWEIFGRFVQELQGFLDENNKIIL